MMFFLWSLMSCGVASRAEKTESLDDGHVIFSLSLREGGLLGTTGEDGSFFIFMFRSLL